MLRKRSDTTITNTTNTATTSTNTNTNTDTSTGVYSTLQQVTAVVRHRTALLLGVKLGPETQHSRYGPQSMGQTKNNSSTVTALVHASRSSFSSSNLGHSTHSDSAVSASYNCGSFPSVSRMYSTAPAISWPSSCLALSP